jgi:hypothetical protein
MESSTRASGIEENFPIFDVKFLKIKSLYKASLNEGMWEQ